MKPTILQKDWMVLVPLHITGFDLGNVQKEKLWWTWYMTSSSFFIGGNWTPYQEDLQDSHTVFNQLS